jgi:hypothetical protein
MILQERFLVKTAGFVSKWIGFALTIWASIVILSGIGRARKIGRFHTNDFQV